jgi:CBS domain-containing protein
MPSAFLARRESVSHGLLTTSCKGAHMVAIPTAADLLSSYSVTLEPGTAILDAIQVLVGKRVAGAPVVDQRRELVGMLTEKDCLRVLSNSTWGEVTGGRVKDFQSEPSVVIDAGADLFEVASAFLRTNFPVLPVLSDGKLLGRVTRADVLARMGQLGQTLERERENLETRLRRRGAEPAAIEALAAASGPQQLLALLEQNRG